MDRIFGGIKAKKSEALSNQTLSDEAFSLKALDLKLLDEAIQAANSKRRMIGVWSPTIAAAMWYLKGTIPWFSIREVASHWIEEGLERDYPELVQKMKGRDEKINCEALGEYRTYAADKTKKSREKD